jgi:hypothetical protein
MEGSYRSRMHTAHRVFDTASFPQRLLVVWLLVFAGCGDGTEGDAEPDAGPMCSLETCDGVDDDCDGILDEDTDSTCDAPNATGRCIAAQCELECATGFGDCNGDPDDGCETVVGVSAADCGGCGVACADGEACMEGGCVPMDIDAFPVPSWFIDTMAATAEGIVLARDEGGDFSESRLSIVAYDSSLGPLWTQSVTASDPNLRISGLAVDGTDSVYTAGSVGDTTLTVGTSDPVTRDYACCTWQWAGKLGPDGTPQWLLSARGWNSGDVNGAGTAIATRGDDLFLAGTYKTGVSVDTIRHGFLATVGATDGARLWSRALGDEASAAVILPGTPTVVAAHVLFDTSMGPTGLELQDSDEVFISVDETGSVTGAFVDDRARPETTVRIGDTLYYVRHATDSLPGAIVARGLDGAEVWSTASTLEAVSDLATDGVNLYLLGSTGEEAATLGPLEVPARPTGSDIVFAALDLDGAPLAARRLGSTREESSFLLEVSGENLFFSAFVRGISLDIHSSAPFAEDSARGMSFVGRIGIDQLLP